MGSFSALLEKNALNRRCRTARTECRLKMILWIERNYRRRQGLLGNLNPTEYETNMANATALVS